MMGKFFSPNSFESLDYFLQSFDRHFCLIFLHKYQIDYSNRQAVHSLLQIYCMKKPQLKLQDKNIKKPQQIYKYAPSSHYYSYSSAQNLRAVQTPKESDSPNKNQTANRNSRKPQFIKNLGKANEDKRKQVFYQQTRQQERARESAQKVEKRQVVKQKQLRQTIKNDVSEYQKLHDKLNYLQSKINEMSSNIDKKRQQKLQFLQNQKKDRVKRFQQAKMNNDQGYKMTDSLRQFVTQVNEGKDYAPCSFNPYSPRNNIYYVSQILKFHKDERTLARQHIMTSAQYLKVFETKRQPTAEEAEKRALKLPRKAGTGEKKTVIFDLDETLIHCNDSLNIPYDVKIQIKFPTGEEIQAGINIRPYAIELLRALSKNFEIIVFTASHSCYANVVLDYLDPNNEYIHHRLYREHCYVTAEGVYVKDLRILNRDPSQMVLVDNAAYSYVYQLDNAIPILPYYKGNNDYELKALQTYIQGMIFQKDVRQVNKKTFKLHRYREFDDIDHLVRSLYGEFA